MLKHSQIDLLHRITNLIIKVSKQVYIPTYGYIVIINTDAQHESQHNPSTQLDRRGIRRSATGQEEKTGWSQAKGHWQPQNPSVRVPNHCDL
jgi:hypothetical protein